MRVSVNVESDATLEQIAFQCAIGRNDWSIVELKGRWALRLHRRDATLESKGRL
jgi:hypothetical protein